MSKSKYLSVACLIVAFSMLLGACNSAAAPTAQKESGNAAAPTTKVESSNDTTPAAKPESEKTAAPSSEEITLTWANWQFTETAKADQLRGLMKKFQETHPNVKFEEVSAPWAEYEASMITRWSGGQGPDLVMLPDATFPKAVSEGYLAPLDDLIDLSKYKDNFSSIMATMIYDGKTYGFVTETNIQELIFNQTLFEQAGLDPAKPPKNYDEWVDYCKKIEGLGEDIRGYGIRNSMDQSFGWYADYSSWAYGFGGRWAKEGTPTVNSPENIEALTAFKAMYDSGCMTQGVTSANYRKAFGLGQVGFLSDNQSLVNGYHNDYPELKVGTAVLPLPKSDAVAEVASISISNDSKHKTEAAAFIEFWMQPDTYQNFNETAWNPTCGMKDCVSQAWIEKNPATAAFIKGSENADTIVPQGLGPYLGEFRDLLLSHMEKVLLQNADVKAELDMAQAEIEKMLASKK